MLISAVVRALPWMRSRTRALAALSARTMRSVYSRRLCWKSCRRRSISSIVAVSAGSRVATVESISRRYSASAATDPVSLS